MLAREEYVEQAYFFRVLVERLGQNLPLQELLEQTRHELLATTKLPMAIDLMLAELKHRGQMSSGMALLRHYFSPFQTFVVAQAETDRGRFDYRTALRFLAAEADYRSREINLQGLFFFEFEAMSRNRLNYDRGLKAMAEDATFSDDWKAWILNVRRQLGLVDLADMIYARSELFRQRALQAGESRSLDPVLFGVQEGKIAQANRRKDTLFLFAAMQRHLGYPSVPRQEPIDPLPSLVPQLQRRLERLEARMKLFEEEQRGGIDITKFYGGKMPAPPDDLLT
ncbi:MAG: hypothetical protein ACTHOU_13590 [Aureliella sp.]|jgi:hypothetical protein